MGFIFGTNKTKKIFNLLGISFLSIVIFTSCTRVTTHVNEIDITSPTIKLPVNITQNKKVGDLEIKPSFSYSKRNLLSANTGAHMNVNGQGIYELEYVEDEHYYLEYDGRNTYSFNGDNLNWNVPEWNAALYMDQCFAEHMAITIGINYSKINNNDYWDNYFGLAFFNEIENQAWRLDFGIRNYYSKYTVEYIERFETPRYSDDARKVYVYSYSNKQDFTNGYLAFTLNSKKTDQKINYFFSGGISSQNLFSFRSEGFEHDKLDKESSHYFLSTGIFYNINKYNRIITGVKLNQQDDLGEDQTSYSAEYFMQFDINVIELFKN